MKRLVKTLAWGAVGFFMLWAAPVWAQEVGDDIQATFESWEDVAGLAETTIDRDAASDERFERLRAQLAAYRSQFTVASQVNADRIATLRKQIEALGAVPENGDEPVEIKARRAELSTQLEKILEPVRVAEEAFSRADGLIREIDTIIRDRQARRLLSLGPSPLNPVHWPTAFEELFNIISPGTEEVAAFRDPVRQKAFREKLPLILLLIVVALALIIRGRVWAGAGLNYLRQWGGRGTGVWGFLVSLLRILLPLSGLFVLAHAIRMTGMINDVLDQFVGALPFFGFVLLWFRWLSERLFSRFDDIALIPLPSEKRAAMRFYMLLLSMFFMSSGVADLLLELGEARPTTEAVLYFPFVILNAIVLGGMGQTLRGYVVEADQPGEEAPRGSGLARILRGLGTTMIIISIVAPVMAGIGYGEAGGALLFPMVISLVILGFLLTLQRFFADVYCLVTKQGLEARETLVPVIIGFVLALLSAPLLALAWGVRVVDLTEIWASFSRGFEIGDTRISPGDFATFAVIFVVGYTITRLVQSTIRINVLPKTKMDIGGQNAIVSGLGYVGIFLAALMAVTGAGLDLSSLAIVAGALSVGIGFGLQTIVSNFVSGIILLIERPISEGDWIEVGGQMGYVRDISVRATRIETFDRTDVIVPNADLVSGTVTNYTRGNKVGRLIVSVGVAYGTDTRRVEAILKEIANDQPMVLSKPEPMILFNNFGSDALEFEMRMILRDVNWIMNVKNDINHAIAERFAQEGIEVPFAQRDIWLRNPESLKDARP